ncbi:MAG: BCCT family transporter [Gammaproteobacteria bacterium]|nr:BCCT family transporter [Gammaproteobacteria bacterium]
MALPPPLVELKIEKKKSGFYEGFNQTVTVSSKVLIALIVIWAAMDPERAGQVLREIQNWALEHFNAYYIYAVAFYVIVCLFIALYPPFGKVKLGPPDGKPEFADFSWFSMMFGAGIGIGMLGYAAAEPIWHLGNNPEIIMSKEAIVALFASNNIALGEGVDVFAEYHNQLAAGAIPAIDGLAIPKTESAVGGAYRYAFLHWGLGTWATYSLVGITLAFFSYRRGLPLTIRSGLSSLFGRSMEGPLGSVVDIAAVLSTLLGISQTIGLGLNAFASGLHNITGADWLMTAGENPEPTTGALLLSLAVVMILSTASALSGVGKGIKWLSNTNMVLSFSLLTFFLIFGATAFAFELLGKGIFNYIVHLPAMTLTVWDPSTELGGWQTGWSVFFWAWAIAFGTFVGIFLARISKNRTIREFVAGAIVAPSLMCFIWFTFVGGTAIDLELSGAAEGRIFGSNLTYQLYEVINIMLSPALATLMSIMIVILLLTYLVTSADSSILVINTINSGGDHAVQTGQKHLFIWGIALTAVIGVLLLAGGLRAIQSAMIVGTIPFTMVLILMGVGLLKALWRDNMRSKESGNR